MFIHKNKNIINLLNTPTLPADGLSVFKSYVHSSYTGKWYGAHIVKHFLMTFGLMLFSAVEMDM